ncbi:hypothetical protein [Polaromonas sp. YR568]|uniref:hypothetical protein n=1 Tax=Polaromonas sp. YR568 TaxID=1855301 RepID=UPI0031382BA5
MKLSLTSLGFFGFSTFFTFGASAALAEGLLETGRAGALLAGRFFAAGLVGDGALAPLFRVAAADLTGEVFFAVTIKSPCRNMKLKLKEKLKSKRFSQTV